MALNKFEELCIHVLSTPKPDSHVGAWIQASLERQLNNLESFFGNCLNSEIKSELIFEKKNQDLRDGDRMARHSRTNRSSRSYGGRSSPRLRLELHLRRRRHKADLTAIPTLAFCKSTTASAPAHIRFHGYSHFKLATPPVVIARYSVQSKINKNRDPRRNDAHGRLAQSRGTGVGFGLDAAPGSQRREFSAKSTHWRGVGADLEPTAARGVGAFRRAKRLAFSFQFEVGDRFASIRNGTVSVSAWTTNLRGTRFGSIPWTWCKVDAGGAAPSDSLQPDSLTLQLGSELSMHPGAQTTRWWHPVKYKTEPPGFISGIQGKSIILSRIPALTMPSIISVNFSLAAMILSERITGYVPAVLNFALLIEFSITPSISIQTLQFKASQPTAQSPRPFRPHMRLKNPGRNTPTLKRVLGTNFLSKHRKLQLSRESVDWILASWSNSSELPRFLSNLFNSKPYIARYTPRVRPAVHPDLCGEFSNFIQAGRFYRFREYGSRGLGRLGSDARTVERVFAADRFEAAAAGTWSRGDVDAGKGAASTAQWGSLVHATPHAKPEFARLILHTRESTTATDSTRTGNGYAGPGVIIEEARVRVRASYSLDKDLVAVLHAACVNRDSGWDVSAASFAGWCQQRCGSGDGRACDVHRSEVFRCRRDGVGGPALLSGSFRIACAAGTLAPRGFGACGLEFAESRCIPPTAFAWPSRSASPDPPCARVDPPPAPTTRHSVGPASAPAIQDLRRDFEWPRHSRRVLAVSVHTNSAGAWYGGLGRRSESGEMTGADVRRAVRSSANAGVCPVCSRPHPTERAGSRVPTPTTSCEGFASEIQPPPDWLSSLGGV
ncbi:hypothetical protein C8R43DRAFT_950825 [Mycena crocata]|nr:hypothetical protein C8R43DRAFT_950825 [Mycena crocata]